MNSAEAEVTAAPGSSAPADDGGIVARYERATGSMFRLLFSTAFFDQTMLPGVSAALEDTGRIRNDPIARGLRSDASLQLAFFGHEPDSRAEMERLMQLHRDVKGTDGNGVRYSALNPELWNFVNISTFFVFRNAFVAISGEQPDTAGNQAIWDHFRRSAEGLQLPGRSRLIENYDELCAYYDQVVAEKLEVTSTLECAVQHARRPARPDFIPAAAAPVWNLAGPMFGHVLEVLGYGLMHPGVRDLVPTRWTRRHDLEFTVLTTAMRFAYSWLPARLTDTPMARNRREYQRLKARYQGIGLASFAPDSPRPNSAAPTA